MSTVVFRDAYCGLQDMGKPVLLFVAKVKTQQMRNTPEHPNRAHDATKPDTTRHLAHLRAKPAQCHLDWILKSSESSESSNLEHLFVDNRATYLICRLNTCLT